MKALVVLVLTAVFQHKRCLAQQFNWRAPYSMMRAQFPGSLNSQSNTLKFGSAPDDEDYGDGKIDGEPMFLFHPDDFDYIPVYPGSINPNPAGPSVYPTTDIPDINPTYEPDSSYCDYDPSQELSDQNGRINRSPNRRVSDIQCEYNMWSYKHYILEIERRKHCYNGTSGIFGGSTATIGDFPHVGAIGWRYNIQVNGVDYLFMCGSSLISTRFALTAAHCRKVRDFIRIESNLAKSEPEVVRFGSVYVGPEKKERVNHFTDVPIKKFIYLDNYVDKLKYNDIMLIGFDTDVPITHNIRPACLFIADITGLERVNVTGWGRTENDVYSDVLLYAEVAIADRQKCAADYRRRMPRRSWLDLQDHQFCAGTQKGVDTCDGDSGGPLQIQEKLPTAIDYTGMMYYVVGITSFGKNCATSIPAVYTKVSDPNILCWIERTVWPDEKNDLYCPGPIFQGYKYNLN